MNEQKKNKNNGVTRSQRFITMKKKDWTDEKGKMGEYDLGSSSPFKGKNKG